MARPYSPLAVLRHMPGSLVRRFCESAGVPLAVRWGQPISAADLFEAWRAVPLDAQARFEQMLQWVHRSGTGPGVRSLAEEAAFQGYSLDDLPADHGLPAAALHCLVSYPPVFHHVFRPDAADRLPARHWHRTPGFPHRPPDHSREACRPLEQAVGRILRAEQGRGQRVTVEHYLRAGREHYFFCYPDDYPHTHVGHNALGRLDRTPIRQAFEVIFAFDPDAGALEPYAPGPRAVRERLTALFADRALRAVVPDLPPNQPVYELDALLDRSFAFPTDPADGVRQARVTKLRVALPDCGRRVELEGGPAAGPRDVFDLLGELLPPAAFPRHRLNVVRATFALTVRPPDGSGTGRSRSGCRTRTRAA